MKFKLFWKYFKYDSKKHFFMNAFMAIQIILTTFVLTFVFSHQMMTSIIYSRHYRLSFYDDITLRRMTEEQIEEFELADKEVLGSIMDYAGAIQDKPNSGTVAIADKFIFDNFKLPLEKGRYPKSKGETLVSWNSRDEFELGKTYKFEMKNKLYDIKVVGFTRGNMGYSHNGDAYMMFDSSRPRISVLWDNVNEVIAESAFSSTILKLNCIRMSAKEVEEVQSTLGVTFDHLSNMQYLYEQAYYSNGTMRQFFAIWILLIAFVTIVVAFSNILINKINNNIERAVSFICGQTRGNIMLSAIVKNVISFIVATAISVIPTYYIIDYGIAEFALSYSGWAVASTIVFVLVGVISALNCVVIKNQNMSMTLNSKY